MLASLLALALMQQQISPDQRGSWLYHACKGAIRVSDAPNASSVANEDLNSFDSCSAYIAGWLDGLPKGVICAGSATYGTFTRVYVAYMDKNPALLDTYRFVGLYQALSTTYPCPVK